MEVSHPSAIKLRMDGAPGTRVEGRGVQVLERFFRNRLDGRSVLETGEKKPGRRDHWNCRTAGPSIWDLFQRIRGLMALCFVR